MSNDVALRSPHDGSEDLPSGSIRVMLVDDHPLVLEGLHSMLSTDPGIEVVAQANGGREAIARAQVVRPDLILMDIRMTEGRILETVGEIIAATIENHPLVARTEFGEEEGYHVVLDYPVKTMNANERDGIYQTDTGPVILPDLSGAQATFVERFRLAFVAFNAPDWAEFIVQVPTPIAQGISVNHYSEARRLNARNSLIDVQ